MVRYLGLYIIALAGLIAGTNLPNLSFLAPLSIAILLIAALLFMRSKRVLPAG